jgi:hypothetical protein
MTEYQHIDEQSFQLLLVVLTVCPERQATCFGSFFLKDAPAMGKRNYTLGSNVTADMGRGFLETLTPPQAKMVSELVDFPCRPPLEISVSPIREGGDILERYSTCGIFALPCHPGAGGGKNCNIPATSVTIV